jgi:Fe-Mn family superoxide dismutase
MTKKIELDINSIVKDALRGVETKLGTDMLQEAYVVQQDTFSQVSENVSQKTKMAHANLYKGYVESLNRISAELDASNKDEANSRHSTFRSLKLDETYNANAAYLHQLYFKNCFDPHSEIFMDSLAYMRLQRDFGTFDSWQTDFIACALAAGNGWAVCGYNVFLKRYMNVAISHHSGDVMLGFIPLVVLDMWEHAYFHDYLDDKKSYIVSLLKELNWDVIEGRIKSIDEAATLLNKAHE